VEERHKATILGFFNILPWVELRVPELGAGIVPIVFFFGTTEGTGNANFQLSILNPDGTELNKSPEVPVTFPKGFGKMNVAMGVENLIFRNPGKHLVRLRVSGQQKYESSLIVALDPLVKP
jgi:hypothetical protein